MSSSIATQLLPLLLPLLFAILVWSPTSIHGQSSYNGTCDLYRKISVNPSNYQEPIFQTRTDLVFIVDYTQSPEEFGLVQLFILRLLEFLKTSSVVVIHPDSTRVSMLVIGGTKLVTLDGISSDESATNACVFNAWVSSLVYGSPEPRIRTYSNNECYTGT